MPRTAVNLPDPTQNPARGVVNNADDLLSQMAGEELDRLLSEAESQPAEASGFELPGESAPDAGEASLNELFDELDDKDLPTLAEDETPAPVPPPFSKAPIGEPVKAPAAAPAPAPVAKAPAPAPKAAEKPLSAADDLAAEMEADERAHAEALRRMKQGGQVDEAPAQQASFAPKVGAAAVEEAAVAEAAAASTVPVEQPVTIDPDLAALGEEEPQYVPSEPSTPFLVRLLEWMNAPLAGVSAGMREVMGKIAIITTLNAIGVFVYVLFFRRH
jgi:hypothetical protein